MKFKRSWMLIKRGERYGIRFITKGHFVRPTFFESKEAAIASLPPDIIRFPMSREHLPPTAVDIFVTMPDALAQLHMPPRLKQIAATYKHRY